MIARALAPLDALRALVLGVFGPLGRRLLSDRAARVLVYALLGIVCALLATCAAPLWAFALGPIVLGVPHLLSDVRYLVVGPGLHRRYSLAVAAGVPIALALVTRNTALGLAACLGAIACAEAPRSRKLALAALVAPIAALAAAFPYVASLVLVHAHNFVAVALFLFVFARSRRVGVAAALAFGTLAIAILAGGLDRFVQGAQGPTTSIDLDMMIAMLSPVSDPVIGARIVLLFVFAQGAHYVVWLRLVPEERRDRPGLRSFTSSFRALVSDLGRPLLALATILAIAIFARALVSLEDARIFYLGIAGFHAHLEIVFAVLFALEGRALLRRPS